jgi:hypothetical protein
LQRDEEIISKEYIEEVNSASDSSKIWSFDEQTGKLVDKLNEPSETRKKTLVELSKCYEDKLRTITTNKNWRDYKEWDVETRNKNHDNTF